ncbi:MAG: GlmU family protein [Ignavibacteriales bacterium]|nr:GlmU family protein [Ignavibacteriales bacterium]
MARHICLFEDAQCAKLLPLVYFRPVYNLKCGILSLREKVIRLYPKAELTLHCRPYLTEYVRLRDSGLRVNELAQTPYLFLNGRVIADENLAKQISDYGGKDCAFVHGDLLIAASVSGTNLKRVREGLGDALSLSLFDQLPRVEIEAHVISYPWDLVHHNGQELRRDFDHFVKTKRGKRIRGKVHQGVHLLNKADIYIDEGATVKPGVVLDAEDGPIYIGRKAKIFPQATLTGPVSVGDQSWIKIGAQIYEDTSIGPLSKVGGEVEGSIIHGYSNKQHGGFLGHSYIGTWVNLGADTNNSDLKNNYGSVKVTIGTEQIDTGRQFVGLTMGDHSKSAINSMFNTGTVVGVSSNIFGHGFPPKYVPSFSWGAAGERFTTYNVDRAIDVARRVMSRRKVELTTAEDRLFRTIFEMTAHERRRRGMPN